MAARKHTTEELLRAIDTCPTINKLFELVNLGFGKCKFALATKKDYPFYDGFGVKTIAYSAMALAHTAVVKIEVSEITGKHHLK